ncbi:MAG TPA: SDR family oxidoreductase [Novosphingobium sp.]|nr:SDR family oxidoreductase [Novosphingobium sp.]HZV10707.1 SDR family oxidoreductase [Novosphingobium sp.]
MPTRAASRPSVLITGAARRIGATLARAFGAAGWHVVLHHHDRHARAEAKALAASLPSAETVACDLLDAEAALAMVRKLAARLADWRLLVNCAAVFRFDDATALDPALFAEAMRVNAETPIRMAQAYLAPPAEGGARATGGRRVIQFTDMKVLNPNPDFFSYTLAKQAMAASVKLLAMGAGGPQDRIYGLAPGAMLPSWDQAAHEHETSGRMNLLQRLTLPEELAEAALFLAEGWLASGETLCIDSGQHLLAQPRDVLYLART